MIVFWRSPVWVLITVGLVGCSGLTQLQDSVTKFDQGVHSASTAQMNFFLAVQTADCNHQFYTNAYNWALDISTTFDLSGACKPTILEDKQIQTRQSLMDAITLYADKMAALATSDDNKALNSNAQELAGNLSSLAKTGGFSSLPVAAGVEAAIIATSDMVLDKKRFADITTAATDMAKPLETVVTTLKAENTTFGVGIASKIGGIEENLRVVLTATHATRGRLSFFDVVEARRIMQSVNPFSPVQLDASKGAVDPKSDPQNVAQQLNAALDAVVNANKAIASASMGGIIAAINDLIARAQAAQTIQRALNK
jgi:hypothetical protein